MLTTDQADHFRTFGFAVLRGYPADRTGVLRTEADAALRDAYAATYHERVIDGISGHYLPMASRPTPVSASLVCDDPRFTATAEQLLGGPVIRLEVSIYLAMTVLSAAPPGRQLRPPCSGSWHQPDRVADHRRAGNRRRPRPRPGNPTSRGNTVPEIAISDSTG
jgi:hypothetical protein